MDLQQVGVDFSGGVTRINNDDDDDDDGEESVLQPAEPVLP